ncbi:radical SAM protein [Hwanghaeella grinnelliae]|uniref:Radical SAM protein n=1 Tax=Hwanghaeella grinnelliae TaxID=2500179 RepID=A0A437QYN2_9PROT|nr:radical SAM protein [Hwanghaeella grinnelliae]RVU39612.1 radical SAM protein [Hwanghaeella grinnelliae]
MEMTAKNILKLSDGISEFEAEGKRVFFSPYRLFNLIDRETEAFSRLCEELAGFLRSQERLYVYARTTFFRDLQQDSPALASLDVEFIDESGLAALADDHPTGLPTIFIAEIDARDYFDMQLGIKKLFRAQPTVLDFSCLTTICPEQIPYYCWGNSSLSVYPLEVPKVEIQPGLDLLLLDCPARNLSLMPNGLAYVHNALKKTTANFQTLDLDIITYHNYHIHRIHNLCDSVVLPSGLEMPEDPWQAAHYDIWFMSEVIDYFGPVINEVADKIVAARPKILAMSIQACNETFSRRLINIVRARSPETIILLGGYSCYNADIGLRAFPEADYMCVGEADLSIGPLVESLIRDEHVANMPGVISRNDDTKIPFIPAPMQHNLDELDFPKYEWIGTDIYVNFNGYRLTPVIASRGCRWARCTFCAERFYWRIRSPKNFVDELEWLASKGCHLFMFNESDLNGHPEMLLAICDEIIRRGLKVLLTGQLRIHKKCTRAYFDKLKKAGFVALRFGVDAFSANALRLQKKGYTTETISNVLRDCHEAGIASEINWVIGVPGETEEDIDEGIDLILQNKKYINRLANINPLILSNGSVYWLEPEEHNIKFRLPQEELYKRYFRAIPAHLWYSEEPYIDANVRKRWFEKILLRLHESDFTIGDWAKRVIEDVVENKDVHRVAIPQPETEHNEHVLPNPVLRENYKGFDIYELSDTFYAVPENIEDVSFLMTGVMKPGVITDLTEQAVKSIIDESLDWANSRSMYRKRISEDTKGKPELRLSPFMKDAAFFEYDGFFYAVSLADTDAKASADTVRSCKVVEYKVANWFGRLITRTDNYKIIGSDSDFYAVPLSVHRMEAHMVNDLKRYGIRSFAHLEDAVRFAKDMAAQAPQNEGKTTNAHADENDGNMQEAFGPAFGNFFEQPKLLEEVDSYLVIGYEGFVYGLPKQYGDVDLTQVDVMTWPGVLRDVSNDAVIEQILEKRQTEMVYGRAQVRV